MRILTFLIKKLKMKMSSKIKRDYQEYKHSRYQLPIKKKNLKRGTITQNDQ